MNEEKFRMLRERLLESLEEYREIGDQEIYQRIDELLLDDSMEHYMRLAERYALRKELFNSIRRLDILQELLEDDTITEIMVNGTDGIFIERYGRLTRWEKCFGSAEKLIRPIPSASASLTIRRAACSRGRSCPANAGSIRVSRRRSRTTTL